MGQQPRRSCIELLCYYSFVFLTKRLC